MLHCQHHILVKGLTVLALGSVLWIVWRSGLMVTDSIRSSHSGHSTHSESSPPKANQHHHAMHAAPAAMQDFGRGGRRGRRTPDRSDYVNWEVARGFERDVFTFVRIQFDTGGYRRGPSWNNDFPDCDWNFSARLQELTSLEVDPNGRVMRLTDDQLHDYPFIFMSNVQNMRLSPQEAEALGDYLSRGGFLMADDFWAPRAWEHVKQEMLNVFPNRQPRELKDNHPIFNIVYQLQGVPQVPSIFAWQRGETFEYWHGDPEGDEDPHFWGYFDDDDRLMALFCHNNDIGDGWEREGENPEYFRDYSERVSFPLGINIVTYVMTH